MSMTFASSRLDAETLSPTTKSARRKGGKKGSLLFAPMSDYRRREFEQVAGLIRADLGAEGPLEGIYAERAVLAAWRLHEATQAEQGLLNGRLGLDTPELFDRLVGEIRLESDRAERAFRDALNALEQVRGTGRGNWGRAARLDTKVPPIEDPIYDAPASPPAPAPAPADEVRDDDAPLPRWQDRLAFEPSVSEDSPVVKGTWVTVSQIVTLIVDGQTWADILRSHPELTEEDIRVCLAFATEVEADTLGVYRP